MATERPGDGSSAAAPASESPSFEEALDRLEAIVRRLESGEVSLEQSLRDFEEGVRLSRLCSARLDEAERKVSLLLADGGGIAEVDFQTGEVVGRSPDPAMAPFDEELP